MRQRSATLAAASRTGAPCTTRGRSNNTPRILGCRLQDGREEAAVAAADIDQRADTREVVARGQASVALVVSTGHAGVEALRRIGMLFEVGEEALAPTGVRSRARPCGRCMAA